MTRIAVIQARILNPSSADLLDGALAFTATNIWQTFDGTNARVIKDWKLTLPISYSDIDINKYPVNPFPHMKLRVRVKNNVMYKEGATLPNEAKDRYYVIAGFASADTANVGVLNTFTRLSFIDV